MGYEITATSDHCYEGTLCLVNKLNIRDETKLAEVETAVVFGKLVALKKQPIQGNFDFAHYRNFHHFLFCDLYDWAGEIRQIDISKKETHFIPVSEIEACANACFERMKNFDGSELTQRELAIEVADFYHTVNLLHPFREGNGRTQRAFFEQWTEERLGYCLNLPELEPDRFMIATIFAAQGVMDQLVACFEDSLKPLEHRQEMTLI